jgi:ethanolamine utilization protein EutQ (cupin superfamily)
MEVDSRMQTDKETKSLIAGLIKNVMSEVSTIKDNSEGTIQKLLKDVKETA